MINIDTMSIITSLVRLTTESMSRNSEIMEGLKKYPFYNDVVQYGSFNLAHYSGTPVEISNRLIRLAQNHKAFTLPAIISFSPYTQKVVNNTLEYEFDLLIAAKTNKDELCTSFWRSKNIFDTLLRPVANTFIEQIKTSGYFIIYPPKLSYSMTEIFTTGEDEKIREIYSDYVDGIRIKIGNLKQNPNICTKLGQIKNHNN